MSGEVTICECGLAKCYHEGTHDIAVNPRNGQKPVCDGYKPRPKNWWKKPAPLTRQEDRER
jgi:hypothetical protein